jgi:hypothetical protein
MNIWACFSTAVWLNTGRTQPWLHYLPLLFGCCSVGYLLVIAAMKRWKQNPESRETRSWITKFASRLSKIGRTGGSSKYAPVWFSVFCCAALVYGAVRLQKPPNYVLMHDVWVEDRTSDYDFRGLVKNPETAEWTEFIVPGCHDFVPTREIKRGATLKMLQFIEDRINSCYELDGNYAGYTLLRDAHDNAIYSPSPRPPAPSSQTQGAN